MKRLACVATLVFLQFACSKSPQSYVDRGNSLVSAGKYADAEIQYRKSVAKAPNLAEGYYRLGLVEHHLRRSADALQDLQRATSLDPANDRYGAELAGLAIEIYQAFPSNKSLYDQASHEADVLLKKNPNSFDGLRLRGDVFVIDRKYDEALSDFRRANAIKPNDPNVVLAMAQVLFAENHDREGEEIARQFLTLRKDYPPIYDILEAHYIQNQRTADAENLLQAEVAAIPTSAQPLLRLARLYRTENREREMSQALQKIVADRADFPSGPAMVGDFYAQDRKWDEALNQYRAGLARASNSDRIMYDKRMAQALEALGKRKEALDEVNAVLKIDPQDPEMRLMRALMLRQSRDAKERDSGIAELKALAGQYPENAAVHYNLALSYLTNGDVASAWQESQKSSNLSKDYVAPRLLAAEIAQTEHNYALALEAAQEALALDPSNADARLLKVAALVETKSFRRAETELNALSKLQPNSEVVDLEFAALAVAEKDYPKAEVLYRRYYRPGSSDLRPLQGLLQVYDSERQSDKGQALLQAELKQEPDSRPVRMLLASVATRQGKFDIATEQYRWLQAKDPKSPQTYAALGDLYQREGSIQDALANYEKASELAPKDKSILNILAVLQSNSGQAKQAIATLNKQLALDPNNAEAMNNLAFDLAETGQDLDRALNLAETAARKIPAEPGVMDTLAWVYVKRGLYQSAIQILRTLEKKYPNESTYHYHLAVALLHDNQASEAKHELLAALTEHPPKELSSRIQENLAQIR
ncbi:MAG: tetratricopeptide repeat protein [Bryobacteraceae bacterium]